VTGTRTRLTLSAILLALALGACGGRVEPPVALSNERIVSALRDLPVGQPVAEEVYGYELGGEAADEFFTEVEYARPGDVGAGDIVAAVRRSLGDEWEVAALDGSGCCVAAAFSQGDARVAVTTWDDGFDVTVAADGAVLDGTRLDLTR